MKKKHIASKIISTILLIIAIIALVKVYEVYKTRDYNEFIRAEREPYTSMFTRDKEITTNSTASYKIESNKFNDAMFYKTVKVQPGTPYKVKCKVKTENVKNEINNNGGRSTNINRRNNRKIKCN